MGGYEAETLDLDTPCVSGGVGLQVERRRGNFHFGSKAMERINVYSYLRRAGRRRELDRRFEDEMLARWESIGFREEGPSSKAHVLHAT